MNGENPVKAQYDAYPYPHRDPADESRRLITGSPSHLPEMAHWLFQGRIPTDRPFRVLVAGGGTGDGLVMLAQQTADAGIDAQIIYLDLSEAARDVARARIAARGLADRVAFRIGSLLEAPDLGPFDYIDCCGVLHHLPAPGDGFAALARALAPDGGMGLMVYGAHGRTGVYDLQRALKSLAPEGAPPGVRVDSAKALLGQLPATNRFRRNPLMRDHLDSDAGLFDLLLHSTDRAYRVPDLLSEIESAGLRLISFIDPLRYDPSTYLSGDLQARARELGRGEQAALAEDLAGNLRKHICYVVRQDRSDDPVAEPTPDTVPVFRDPETAATFKAMPEGSDLPVGIDGLTLTVPLPRTAKAILDQVDGRRPLSKIRRRVKGPAAKTLDADMKAVFSALTGFSKLFLSRP